MQHEFYRWSEHRSVLQELKGVRFTTDCRVHLPRSKWTSKILKCLRFHAKMMKFHCGDVFWLLFGTCVFFTYHQSQAELPSDWRTSIKCIKMPSYLGYRSTGCFWRGFCIPALQCFSYLPSRLQVPCGWRWFFSGEITNSHTTVRLPWWLA